MKSSSSKNAFTFIELLLVLSIIAILVSVSAVALRFIISAGNIQYAADRLIADLSRVRDQARIDQTSYTVTFNTAGKSYTAPLVKNPATLAAMNVSLAAPPYNITSLACSLDSQTAVTFNAQGFASPSGSITLSQNSKRIRITISDGGCIEQVVP